MRFFSLLCAFIILMHSSVFAAPKNKEKKKKETTPRETIAQNPYISALVIDAESGKVLFADHPEKTVYPASVLKLMDLYIVLTRLQNGQLSLKDMVQVTPEAARIGGSQVYLDPTEQFSVEDLLYALMVQSANDAAAALAIHIAGSKQAFVDLMNTTAQELGMHKTRFYSEHGLPPAKGQKPDETTAEDLAILCQKLVKMPEALKYTSTVTRPFRNGTFTLQSHNKLLGGSLGIDGLKTGYFYLAGFSIALTANHDGHRVIALVMGSTDRKTRDAKALELLANGFAQLPKDGTAAHVATPALIKEPAPSQAPGAQTEPAKSSLNSNEKTPSAHAEMGSQRKDASRGWGNFLLGLGTGLSILVIFLLVAGKLLKKKRHSNRYL